MADELLSSYIDRQSFSDDTQFAIGQLSQLEAAFDKLKEIKIGMQGTSGIKDFVASVSQAAPIIQNLNNTIEQQTATITKNTEATKQNSSSQDDLSNSARQLQKEKEKLSSLTSDEAKQIAEVKLQQQEQNKANKEAAINTLGLRDSYQQLNAEYQKAAQVAKNLAAQAIVNPAFSQQAQEAAVKAKGLSDVLKTIDSSVGQFQRNVGNYTGAVGILQKGFADAKAKLDSLSESERNNTAAGQQLQKQVQILGSFSQQQSEGFRSLTTELRNSERALRTMYEAGLAGTPAFDELQTVINKTTREVREFGRQQTLLQSESPALAGLTAAARGLGGAYAVGSGAAALFADGNEKVEKELNKLVAIMTLLQGLTEFNRFLQEKESIAKALNTVKTSFLVAAQKLVALTTGDDTKATLANIEAQEAAVVSNATLSQSQTVVAASNTEIAASGEVAAAGLETEAVGAAGLATGLDAVTGSEVAVAEGASAMATAIAATGIGLLIVGLSVAIYKIVGAIEEWNGKIESLGKANEDVVKTLKDLTDATKSFMDVQKEANDLDIQKTTELIQHKKNLGVTVQEGYKLDLQVAEQRKKNAQSSVDELGVTKEKIDLAIKQTEQAAKLLNEETKLKKLYQEGVAGGEGDADYDKKIKSFDDNIKRYKDDYDQKKSNLDLGLNAYKENSDAQAAIEAANDSLAKASADDRHKFILENAKLDADTQTALNERILSNDRSTLSEKLAALKSNLEEQRKVIKAENIAVQSDPTVSATDKRLANEKANAATQKAIMDEADKEYHLKEDARLKELQLTNDTQKDILNVIIKTNQDIYNNDAITEQDRLIALKESMAARKEILDNQFKTDLSSAGISDTDIKRIQQEGFFEIANKKITDAELKKIITEYNIAEVQIVKDTNQEKIKIVTDYLQKEIDENKKALLQIQLENDKIAEDHADTYNNEIIDLNNAYEKKLISLDKYNDKRKKLDADYTKTSLQDQLKNVQDQIKSNQLLIDAQKKAQDELAALKKQDTSSMSADEKKIHDDRIKQITDELKTIQDAVGKETALYKQLSKLLKDISDADHNQLTNKQHDIINFLDKVKQVTDETFKAINGVINISATKQKNALQDQSDAIDRNSQKELDAIQASSLSEQDKAAKTIQINAKVQAQKDEIAIKNREIDRKAAVAQKEEAIFNIILNTAIAISKAGGNPFKIALAAASGAAELAIAVATPIPHYKTGKNDNYEGPAIVGDGGVPEYIKREDGIIEKTPSSDTLTFVKRNDVIYPNFLSMLKAIAMPKFDLPNERGIDNELFSEIRKQTPLLAKIANKRELHLGSSERGMVALWKHTANQTKYLEENTNW